MIKANLTFSKLWRNQLQEEHSFQSGEVLQRAQTSRSLYGATSWYTSTKGFDGLVALWRLKLIWDNTSGQPRAPLRRLKIKNNSAGSRLTFGEQRSTYLIRSTTGTLANGLPRFIPTSLTNLLRIPFQSNDKRSCWGHPTVLRGGGLWRHGQLTDSPIDVRVL